jgi:hypothetical protein
MRRIIEHHFDLPAVIDFPDTDDSLIPAQIHNLLHHPLQDPAMHELRCLALVSSDREERRELRCVEDNASVGDPMRGPLAEIAQFGRGEESAQSRATVWSDVDGVSLER